MDYRERCIQERAYQIWEEQGRPQGRDDEHWRQAEREFAMKEGSLQDEDLEPAHRYDREVEEFGEEGRVGPAAEEARLAVEGSEGKELRRAEQIGKSRARSANDRGKR